MQTGLMLGILAYLSSVGGLASLSAVAMVAATWRVGKWLLGPDALPANDNGQRLAPLVAGGYGVGVGGV